MPTACTHGTLHPSAVPTVTASITSPTGPFTAGRSYTFTCTATVTGGGTLSPTTTITWIHPSGSMTSGTGSSLDLSLNSLRVSDAGQYTCNVSVSSPFFTRAQSSIDTFTIDVQGKLFSPECACFICCMFHSGVWNCLHAHVYVVPSPSVDVDFSTPGAVTYAGNNVTLNCGTNLLGGVRDSDVKVNIGWTKNGAPFSGVSGRVTLTPTIRITSISYITWLIFSPLSSSMDNGTYMCIATLTPRQPQFVTGSNANDSRTLAVEGEIYLLPYVTVFVALHSIY